jgi:hypothetical protein
VNEALMAEWDEVHESVRARLVTYLGDLGASGAVGPGLPSYNWLNRWS